MERHRFKFISLAISLAAALFILLYPLRPLDAGAYEFVFWYPGGEGTQKDAEPIIAAFLNYIKGKTGYEIRGRYINKTDEGIKYIKAKRPTFGIVSWITLEENKGKLPPYKEIAATLPLPHGTDKEIFTIVGKEGWEKGSELLLASSIPISPAFFKKYMMPELDKEVTITETSSIFALLKELSLGNARDKAVLLTPMEMHTFSNLKVDWKGGLRVIQRLKPIPTARLIYFGDDLGVADRLIQALLAMQEEKEGVEILGELRLKGFLPLHHTP